MIGKKSILAIIPARKGSKRLVRKNTLPLKGKPVICWTIEEALKSKYLDEIIISTDDEEIIDLAKGYEGISLPFVRPATLATDTASSLDVILHTLKVYEEKDIEFDYVMSLQPSSPLRKCIDIDNAIEELSSEFRSVVSVCKTDHPPHWCNVLPDDRSMKDFLPKNIKNLRSQDLPTSYRINGAVYISEVSSLLMEKGFFGKTTKAYIMPVERSVDIDTKMDFELCKILMA
ncbi:acylneuraminate cytidylyltransferase family protein [Akkermansiaceae bacterium]|nr:acylneuraminate cytidylyltransferase family protein [Akkermansiaceae bacterium]MDC0291153.1 acylneuraminate cytidylyltransferase family protein [Akkermansiaceae bacterium]